MERGILRIRFRNNADAEGDPMETDSAEKITRRIVIHFPGRRKHYDLEDNDDDELNYNYRSYWRAKFMLAKLKFLDTVRKTIKKDNNTANKVSDLCRLVENKEINLCLILVECCAGEWDYCQNYSEVGVHLCAEIEAHRRIFEGCFAKRYERYVLLHKGFHKKRKIHHVAKFFAHLLARNAISWRVFKSVKYKELKTPCAYFLIVLFQNLAGMGITALKERFEDSSMYEYFKYMFPLDRAINTKSAIKFFNYIGLEDLTDSLHKYLNKRKYVKFAKLRPLKLNSDSSSSESDSGYSDEESVEQKKNRRRKPKGNHISIGCS